MIITLRKLGIEINFLNLIKSLANEIRQEKKSQGLGRKKDCFIHRWYGCVHKNLKTSKGNFRNIKSI